MWLSLLILGAVLAQSPRTRRKKIVEMEISTACSRCSFCERSPGLADKSKQIKSGIVFLPQTLIFSSLCLCRWCRPLIFKTINLARLKCLRLKAQRFKPSGYNDIGIRKFEFMAKTQFFSTMGLVNFRNWKIDKYVMF